MWQRNDFLAALSLCALCVTAIHASAISHDQYSDEEIPAIKGTFLDRPEQSIQMHPWFRTSVPQKVSLVYRTRTTTKVALKFITKQTTFMRAGPTVTSTEYVPITITDTEYFDAEPVTETLTLTVPLVFTTTRFDAGKTVTLTMPAAAASMLTMTVMQDSPCPQADRPWVAPTQQAAPTRLVAVPPPRPIILRPGHIFEDTLNEMALLQTKVADLMLVMSNLKMRTNGRQQQLIARLQRISWRSVLDNFPEGERRKQFDWSIDQLDGLKRMLIGQEMGSQDGTKYFSTLEMFVNNLERMY